MDRNAVISALIAAHVDIQSALGLATGTINSSTCPLQQIAGFESILIPTVLRTVARNVGVTLPAGRRIKNLYVSQDGRQKLDIGQIADRFVGQYAK